MAERPVVVHTAPPRRRRTLCARRSVGCVSSVLARVLGGTLRSETGLRGAVCGVRVGAGGAVEPVVRWLASGGVV